MASQKKVIVESKPTPTRTKADYSISDPVKHRAAMVKHLGGGFNMAKHRGDSPSPFKAGKPQTASDPDYQHNQPREAV